MSWSRRGSFQPTARASSAVTAGGLRPVVDPTLPSYSRAVIRQDGSRAGVVTQVGSQYVGDWDTHSKFDSLMAAAVDLEAHDSSPKI